MENQVPIDKIIRNIASNGVEYSKEVQQWMEVDKDNKKVYQDLFNIWQITGSFPERYSPDRPKAWQKVQNQIHAHKRKYFLYRRIGQIAAAILVIFLSVWTGTELNNWNQKSLYTEVISPAGQKTRIILPDSSIVLLNGNSKIRYNQNFNENNRKVELKGEGYFEVRKDESSQFIVSTSELNVIVFGTTFNVKSYADDQTVEIGLKNGKVGIEKNQKEILQLNPGEVASFDKKGQKMVVKNMDVELVSAWTREEMIFEEKSLEEIITYIERWYGVEIQASPKLLDGELFTFKVKTESLNELLKLINLLKPIQYQVNGKQVTITNP